MTTLRERLDARREIRGPDECWPWVRGSIRIHMGLPGSKDSTELRRAVWFLEHGKLPERYQHLEVSCGNVKCLNPRHIFRQTEEERFWSKVDKSAGPDGCWLWTGTRAYHGAYGQFQFHSKAAGSARAHRLSWELTYGEVLDDKVFVCHRCDVPLCVNPAHLFIGTPADNMHDCIAKGRNSRGPKHSEAMRKAHAREREAKATALSGGATE